MVTRYVHSKTHSSMMRHVLKPGTPEHHITGTPRNAGTAEKPQKIELKLTELFCFPITDHVKKEMSV